jgi:serine/threonine protein kinase
MLGKPIALKWYFPEVGTKQQRKTLEVLIRKGPPTDRFLWPVDIATDDNVPAFGYLMPLRQERYKGIVDLMKGRIDPSFRALSTAGFELANSFLQLHSKGLCYRDISFGNVFLEPSSGEVLICDNDNVAVDGEFRGGILGTPRFMAPEIVRGDAYPNIQSDLFSLAVLLFYIFMVHHPLEGRRELAIHSFDLPAMTKLYGKEPLFIFDPEDRANEAVPGYHDNALESWPIYPKFLRDVFTKAFTAGIRDAEHGRIREGEWRSALVRLRDSIYYCPACGAENFYDPDMLASSGGLPGACWKCKRALRLPFRLRLAKRTIMLNFDTKLFPHHLDDQRMYDFTSPVAEVTRHPQDDKIWGLKNLSTEPWTFTSPTDSSHKEVKPGRSVTLATGIKVYFGSSEGEVRL